MKKVSITAKLGKVTALFSDFDKIKYEIINKNSL